MKLGKEITSSALSSAVAQDTQRSAHDFAHGRHLAADGTWLFVQDSHPDSTYYLGYGTFDAQHASISPDGSHVAWTTTQMIYVENVEDAQDSVRISPPATEAFARSAFIDSNHLIAIDYSGGLHLIDWQKGEELASLDTGGGSREFEIDQSRKLVRGVLQNSGSWLVEYDEGVLKGPYVVQDRGYRGGFLDGGNALWSIDGNSRYHAYTLDELRAGLSAGQLNEQLPPMTGSPLAIDAAGRRLYVEPRGLAAIMKIRDEQEQELQSLELPWTPLQTSVSPDGKKLALVSSDGAVLEVFNSKTGNSMWSMSVAQGIRYIAWSQDSQRIALASQVGAVVAKATSGEQLRVTCAPRFERRSTPPISSVSFMQAQNLCER